MPDGKRLSAVVLIILPLLAGCGDRDGPGHQTNSVELLVLTDANFEREALESEYPVLVDFWADWCQPCLEMKPMIREITSEYAGRIKIGELDIETNAATAERYGVHAVPALLIFNNGKMVRRLNGRRTKDEIKHALQRLIKQRT